MQKKKEYEKKMKYKIKKKMKEKGVETIKIMISFLVSFIRLIGTVIIVKTVICPSEMGKYENK